MKIEKLKNLPKLDHLLEKLFESVAKVRVLRLLVQNPESFFALNEIAKKTQIRTGVCRKELRKLLSIGLVKTKTVLVKEKIEKRPRSKKRPKMVIKGKKKQVYWVNTYFTLYQELKELFLRSSVASGSKSLGAIKGLGKIRLAVIAGVFTGQENSRTDLLLVGDGVNKRKLESFLAHIESELGKSVQYTLMDTDEFKYRLNMYDRFLRDILEYPHQKLINKLGI